LEKISVTKLLEFISRRWQIHSILMIIGGLIGFSFSYLNPPVFESSASFSVTIDYTQTGSLTDIQEDQAMRGVGSVLSSDLVVTQTLEQLKNEFNLDISLSDFFANSFVDREDFRWTLRYRDTDPNKTALIINTWAKNSDQTIQTALSHSQVSSLLLDSLKKMESCLQNAYIGTPESYCGFNNFDSLINSITALSSLIQNEKVSSLGLFNSLSVSLVNGSQNPPIIVLRERNLLVISGALIGLILSIAASYVRFIKWSSSS
jgi:capsular polysaccharide biosynthesis protein